MATITDYFKPGSLRRVETTGRHRRPDPVPPTPKRPVGRPRKRQRLDPEVESVNTHESASVELKDAVQETPSGAQQGRVECKPTGAKQDGVDHGRSENDSATANTPCEGRYHIATGLF